LRPRRPHVTRRDVRLKAKAAWTRAPCGLSHLIPVERPLRAPDSFASPRAHIHHAILRLGVLGAVERLASNVSEEGSSATWLLGTPTLGFSLPTPLLVLNATVRLERRACHTCLKEFARVCLCMSGSRKPVVCCFFFFLLFFFFSMCGPRSETSAGRVPCAGRVPLTLQCIFGGLPLFQIDNIRSWCTGGRVLWLSLSVSYHVCSLRQYFRQLFTWWVHCSACSRPVVMVCLATGDTVMRPFMMWERELPFGKLHSAKRVTRGTRNSGLR